MPTLDLLTSQPITSNEEDTDGFQSHLKNLVWTGKQLRRKLEEDLWVGFGDQPGGEDNNLV